MSTTNRYYNYMQRKISDIQLLKGLANGSYSALSESTMIIPRVRQKSIIEDNHNRLNSSRFFQLKKEVKLNSRRKSLQGTTTDS